ncbi:MAG: hypothetical protein LC104_21700 [Bacteroidales bacterium]|nr:hypothetical protein [Bacteroidales bacterium]
MVRHLLIGMSLLLGAGATLAAPPAGQWKLRLAEGGQPLTFLISFSETEGKWVGDFISSAPPLQVEPTITQVTVNDSHLTFRLRFRNVDLTSFDGIVAADGSKITGTLAPPVGVPQLTEMKPSQLKNLNDPFALAQETFQQSTVGPDLFNSGFIILSEAAAKKLSEADARAIAERMTKAAQTYGPRWERTIALRLANDLAGQPGFTDIALAQAQRAERMLTEDATPAVTMAVMDTLAHVLDKAGKADEAKKYRTLAARLELRDFAESQKSSPLADAPVHAGRKAKSDRAVLVEIFTSADAPPAVAVDLAEAAILKSFQPSEVVVVAYQLHRPTANPLAAKEGMLRTEHYLKSRSITALPAVLVDGKAVEVEGGTAATAQTDFDAIRKRIEKQLELPSPAKLTLTASATETGFSAKATVTDLEKPGDKVFLRFALVESRIRYSGISSTRYHLNTLRAMPGGAQGFPLTAKTGEQTVTIDLAALRTAIGKDLQEFVETSGVDFRSPDRPLALANLKLIAFIQDDATQEVLQAVQVELK